MTNQLVTIKLNETAHILDMIEVNVHATHGNKAVLLVTQAGEDTLHAIEQGDWVMFPSFPVDMQVVNVADGAVTVDVSVTTVH